MNKFETVNNLLPALRTKQRAVVGIEPTTSPTLRENHTTRPNSLNCNNLRTRCLYEATVDKRNTARFKKVDSPGLEPGAFCMQSRRDTATPRTQLTYATFSKLNESAALMKVLNARYKNVHQPGIEPGSRRWQRRILPLNH